MAANNDPIFSKVGDIQSPAALITTAASVVYDASGTIGTDVYKVFTADSTNGGYVQRVRLKYSANGTTASTAAVIKFFISSATSGSISASTAWLFDEVAVPTTGTLTTTAANATYDVPFNLALPPGYTILAKITVSQPASCGWMATAVAGKY